MNKTHSVSKLCLMNMTNAVSRLCLINMTNAVVIGVSFVIVLYNISHVVHLGF